MTDLIAIVYDNEAAAEQMRSKMMGLRQDYVIEIADAVVAVKGADGQIKLNQLINTTTAGALSGMFWGALIGLIFMMPFFGAAVGAASGALSGALTDYGISNDFMKDLATKLEPGKAALFLLISKMTDDKVFKAIEGTGGIVLRTSLDNSKEQALRDAIAKSGVSS